ncbi:ABC transporter substrate-binding protein [Roseospira visakhapatnamensis]|uniref:Phospholipid transport system substrate-binding protein n=1 Tax=Roseospira visakhapatnamensis TaxID=390880 RepID=A0A7W6RCV5_9PROT|nr:ABC transporter substrate-binding protein [Roseospira visakhapatnamensis]MBB4266214.1 phospholipid transport system substrate-binding protein [Roseospira visakhapatnamensis]
MVSTFLSLRTPFAGADRSVGVAPWSWRARRVAARVPLLPGLALLAALMIGVSGSAAASPDATAAAGLVERYQAVLLDVMRRAKDLGVQERARVLDAPVRETFDFTRMARAAAGRTWREADEAARASMVEAFARYSVAVHADRFDGHAGETFVIDGTAPGPGEALLVNTRIVRPKGDDVTLSYVVAGAADAAPRVVDVLMNGSISEVALRRSEWAAIGKRDGLAGLAEALQTLTDRLLAEDTAARPEP